MTPPAARPDPERVREALREAEPHAADLAIFPSDHAADLGPPVGARRRMRRAGEPDPVATVTLLLNDEGVLVWHDAPPGRELPGRRRRRGGAVAPEGEVVETYQFEKLEPNEIGAFLRRLDAKLNPNAGLRRLRNGTLRPADPPRGRAKRLVLVHGTFSKSEALVEGIRLAPSGRAFLSRMEDRYDEVLVFDHPTLSVSPVLNAFDLARLFAAASGPLDVVAHSRGGLVTRWWLEGFGGASAGATRAVLVGSPLGGTSLAAPPRLKDALSVLSNIGTALKWIGRGASLYLPFLAAPVALLKVATSVTSLAARTPLIDAAVAMIPGLAAQSRVADNPEIARLRAGGGPKVAYFAVRSNYETEDPKWRFWRYFRKDKIVDAGADRIFPAENDLVVDTHSMTELSADAFPPSRLLDYGTSATVHHTNYFEQDRTLDFIERSLG